MCHGSRQGRKRSIGSVGDSGPSWNTQQSDLTVRGYGDDANACGRRMDGWMRIAALPFVSGGKEGHVVKMVILKMTKRHDDYGTDGNDIDTTMIERLRLEGRRVYAILERTGVADLKPKLGCLKSIFKFFKAFFYSWKARRRLGIERGGGEEKDV